MAHLTTSLTLWLHNSELFGTWVCLFMHRVKCSFDLLEDVTFWYCATLNHTKDARHI